MDGHRGNVHHIMSNFVTIAIHSCFDAAIFMAAEGKAIIFYRCNLFFLFRQHRWKTNHGISTKLGQ